MIFEKTAIPGAWLVVGRPKIGKSWLILQMALAVAEGGTFLGFECQAAGVEVLAIFGEDDDSRIQSRLAALGVANAPRNCHVINQAVLFALAKRFADTLTFAEFLEVWLTEHPKVRLILVDTETTVRQVWAGERGQDAGPRVTETDYKQTRTFDEIALRRQLVILLVNHASKRKGDSWSDIHELINRANTALAGAPGSIALADHRTPTRSSRSKRRASSASAAATSRRTYCSPSTSRRTCRTSPATASTPRCVRPRSRPRSWRRSRR